MTTTTHICVTCRLLRGDGEPCETGHVVAPIGSDAHLEAVWGGVAPTRPARDSRVPEALWGAITFTGIGIAATVIACVPFTLCSDHPIDELTGPRMWFMVAVCAAIVVPALIYENVDRVGLWAILKYPFPPRRRLEPRGARIPLLPSSDGREGVTTGEAPLVAPLTGRACVAWAVTVEHDNRLFARASASAEFTVSLPDATTVRVPPGRHVLLSSTEYELHPADAWLDSLVPSRLRGARDPFPSAERAREVIVAIGDKVTVHASLQPQPVATDSASYRESPPIELVPTGRVTLVRIR